MLRSTTTLSLTFLLLASPALAQNVKGAPTSSEGVSVAFAPGVTVGLPGIALANPTGMRDLGLRGPLTMEVPGPAVPLGPLDFGAYEPYLPNLARRALPDTPNDTDPFQLTLAGTPTRTIIGAKVQAKTGNLAVQARATSVVPGVPVLGDRANKWRSTPDLKVDVRYKF